MINRRTQTYLRELLQLDGEEVQDSDMEIVLEEDVEIDDQFTKQLINGVISDGVSESDDGTIIKTIKDEGVTSRQNPTGARPDFDLPDIMGEFEIDDAGNYIILRNDDGQLLDKHMRQVNKRGYLIDRNGNVINRNCELIFRVMELDSDDEIPAAIGFDKRK